MNVSKWKFWMFSMVAAQMALLPLAAPAIGQPDLGPEEIVQADGSDLTVSGYSVPSYVDWDNDGILDLVVGEGSGTYTGKVRVYLNTGSVSSPSFSTYSYAQSGGSDLTVTGGG